MECMQSLIIMFLLTVYVPSNVVEEVIVGIDLLHRYKRSMRNVFLGCVSKNIVPYVKNSTQI